MYGFTPEVAEAKAVALRTSHPENRYEVKPHSWTEYGNVPKTWGVVCYVPYTETMPWLNMGFVWFFNLNGSM